MAQVKIRDNPRMRASNWDKLKVRKLRESAPAHPQGLRVCSQLVTESTIMQSLLYKQISVYYSQTTGFYFCHRFVRMRYYPCDFQPGRSKSAALAAAVGGSSSVCPSVPPPGPWPLRSPAWGRLGAGGRGDVPGAILVAVSYGGVM